MRSYAVTIAGLDPSGGAGLTADIKTFEQHSIQGLAVCSAVTQQTEDRFFGLRWEKTSDILETLGILLDRYPVSAIKTGILPSIETLRDIVAYVTSRNEKIAVVVDPVLTTTTGFELISGTIDKELLYETLRHCTLITPNIPEILKITGTEDEVVAAEEMAISCSVLLKGGHSAQNPGTDLLFSRGKVTEFKTSTAGVTAKHGSGCILSAAITAALSKGYPLEQACGMAKKYAEKALASNETLLAFHHDQ